MRPMALSISSAILSPCIHPYRSTPHILTCTSRGEHDSSPADFAGQRSAARPQRRSPARVFADQLGYGEAVVSRASMTWQHLARAVF